LCADFLRDHLHTFVAKEESFPSDPQKALIDGFKKADRHFLEMINKHSTPDMLIDRSGSCAIVVLIVGDKCFVANVGDSRAIMSFGGGKYYVSLSADHTPRNINEQKRVLEAGGSFTK
jgi:protein phosphatase PTC2/3